MRHKIEITEEARLEIFVAYDYYEFLQKNLGEKFLQCLDKYFRKIRETPVAFRENNGYREAFIQKFPYLIIYQIIGYC